jgi:voltage-gated sodium channel
LRFERDFLDGGIVRRIAEYLTQERFVALAIGLNSLVLFLDSFPAFNELSRGLCWRIDYACMMYFLLEIVIKLSLEGKKYWQNGWNRFDFSVVFLSLPSLAAPWTESRVFAAFLLLRIPRLLRFLRLFRFVPHGPKYWAGVKRSLRACAGIFTVLIVLQLVFALGGTMLFGAHDPQNFGDPGKSFYTMFKFFTVDGWADITDPLSARTDLPLIGFLVKAYFIAAVFIGGILGLSIANAIFVDAMTADNTAKVEKMVASLHDEVRQLKEEIRNIGTATNSEG